MRELVEKMNETLINHNLILPEERVLNEFERVDETWDERANQAKMPIKYLIIGEATVSFAKYFYNPDSPETPFLRAGHFACKSKPDLINLFQNNGVLVFDLYPLPLPTFIYDNVKFDCKDLDYVRLLNDYYEAKLGGRIDKNTKVVLRYIKLFERCEWKIFVDFLGRYGIDIVEIQIEKKAKGIVKKVNVPLNIYGSYEPDADKISDIFHALFP